MADTSERIIILSAVILVVIIGQSVKMFKTEPIREDTILTWRDMQIQIATSRDNYTLGDRFTATVYVVNNRSEEVRMTPIYSASLIGGVNRSDGIGHLSSWTYPADAVTTIPPNSKMKIIESMFSPNQSGPFRIACLGIEKTVQILEPLKLGQGIGPLFEDYRIPEVALSHGFEGYINVSYVSEMPPRIIVSPGKVIHYTIRLELIPHVPEFTETDVLLDPENASNFRVDYVTLKNYIRYSPNGTILLRVDEPRNVTMILSVPDGLTGMSVLPRFMLGVGIFADVPVASPGSVGLNRIPRDEYAWITAFVINVELSSEHEKMEISSDDINVPSSLYEALDKALLREISEER